MLCRPDSLPLTRRLPERLLRLFRIRRRHQRQFSTAVHKTPTMAAVRPTSASAHVATPFGQAPAPAAHPHFLQSFDRQTHEAYLKSRGVAYLQRHYRELLKVPEGEEFPPFNPPNALKRGARGGGVLSAAAEGDGGAGSSSKKARVAGASGGAADGPGAGTGDTVAESSQPFENGAGAGAGAASAPAASTAAGGPGIPHIDSTYLLELTTAKPEAGVLALGDPAQDVYLPILGSRQRREDHRALIGALIDRAMESETLFWDLRRLDHDQVRALAEVEWSRQLPLTAGQPSSLSEERDTAAAAASASVALPSASRGGKRAQGQAAAVPQQLQQLQTDEERAMDEEIAQIRRSFCDKTRAQALASRAAAGW